MLGNLVEAERLEKLGGRRLAYGISRVCKHGAASIIPCPWLLPASMPVIRQKSKRNCDCATPLWQGSAPRLGKAFLPTLRPSDFS
jgi:hypothetical protein